MFRPRHAIPLAYRSQDRVPAWEKPRKREVRLLERLGVIEGWPGLPPKPNRMRRPTYRRLASELVRVRAARRLARSQAPRQAGVADPMMDEEPFPSARERWRAATRQVLARRALARC